ncbi:alpha-1,4-glucan--maltose-1-phosphate maltosyltransferase [Arcanobacterium bovis]|uniref:alpha-1,4-glucan--maltose-1-phosphate maltosyltransferase n=1 Tax=Arcanobacterium bovis TaxID=2529275 RepID=UPI001F50384D|nr:alpha-1,4-glucan--maltose-1-phosphate maltosyltransferase [Arcanobacterium bovis]
MKSTKSKAPASKAVTIPKKALIGRIPIVDVSPSLENGLWAAKACINESFPVQATVFREGHDLFGAECVLLDSNDAVVQVAPMRDIAPGLRRYEGWLTARDGGAHSFFVRAWSDPVATWVHNAKIKIDAGVDIELVFLEAEQWLNRAITGAKADSKAQQIFTNTLVKVKNSKLTPAERLAAATSVEVNDALSKYPVRDFVTESARYPVFVDRQRALIGSWYEIFVRTTGCFFDRRSKKWVSGTLKTAALELDRIAGMGFDVVYLTPIHPIGTTNRKGRNNTLTAEIDDPGSPYAIGSELGGHDAINPELGTFADFDAFVARARQLGMEVALDIALQCSPDHPWVKEHPEWFTTRADGTIAYAENPPKKYQDIYPLNFDNDPEGIYQEIKRVLELWVSHGVTIFRVDNPHTKPLNFWQRLLHEFRIKHPQVIFLAEAFTQPPMMQTLGMIGFHQSYTYFTWRNDKEEIEEYLQEVSRESDARIRPAFWPTTHDILTPYMQRGGTPAFHIRAILAATSSPTWGIYSGYELAENIARQGAEEQIDNEKYEFKERNFAAAEHNGIAKLLRELNAIRANHPALQRLRNLTIHPTSNDKILCFSKTVRLEENNGNTDSVIVVLNLDPYASREAVIDLDVEALGAQARWDAGAILEVTDELSGETYEWNHRPYVRLDPHGRVAHILNVKVL